MLFKLNIKDVPIEWWLGESGDEQGESDGHIHRVARHGAADVAYTEGALQQPDFLEVVDVALPLHLGYVLHLFRNLDALHELVDDFVRKESSRSDLLFSLLDSFDESSKVLGVTSIENLLVAFHGDGRDALVVDFTPSKIKILI